MIQVRMLSALALQFTLGTALALPVVKKTIHIDGMTAATGLRDGGFVVLSRIYQYDGREDIVLSNFDSLGLKRWSKSIDHSLNYQRGWSLMQTRDGGFAIVGETGGHSLKDRNGFLLKTDSTGKKEFQTTFGSGSVAVSVAETPDSAFVMAGTSSWGNDRTHLIKLDKAGQILWERQDWFHGFSGDPRILATPDSGIVIAYTVGDSIDAKLRVSLAKLDLQGNAIWSKEFSEDSSSVRARDLKMTPTGGFLLAGYKGYGYDSQALLGETDASGNSIRRFSFGEYGKEDGNAYSAMPMGDGWIISGTWAGSSVVAKSDLEGNIVWRTYLGDWTGFPIIRQSPGRFVVCGADCILFEDANPEE
jgi:hypothetical protein